MEKKKVLVLSTGDSHGAYEAMYKIAKILLDSQHEVVFCVKQKTKNEDFIKHYVPKQKVVNHPLHVKIISKIKDTLDPPQATKPLLLDSKYSYNNTNEKSENIIAEDLIDLVGFIPDVILTGMTSWFLNSTDLKNLYMLTKARIYNVTVDMNHLTGGCHFAWDCEGYIRGCDENCPAILDISQKIRVKENFTIKAENARIAHFQIIAGSGLTLEQSKKSLIYKDQKVIHNINSLIDTRILNPKNRNIARKIFDLSDDKFYILCGANNMNDPRKGFVYAIEAFKHLENLLTEAEKEKLVIVVVSNAISKEFEELKFEKIKLDFIKDYRLLSLLYQSINLFLNSSVEDPGPMMVSEALACGSPVVGFNTGILTNMIDNGKNGYKIDIGNSLGLAESIAKIIRLSPEDYQKFSDYGVKKVEDYSSFEYASKIFNEILAG